MPHPRTCAIHLLYPSVGVRTIMHILVIAMRAHEVNLRLSLGAVGLLMGLLYEISAGEISGGRSLVAGFLIAVCVTEGWLAFRHGFFATPYVVFCIGWVLPLLLAHFPFYDYVFFGASGERCNCIGSAYYRHFLLHCILYGGMGRSRGRHPARKLFATYRFLYDTRLVDTHSICSK